MLCVVLTAARGAVSAKDDWLRVQSKNFQLVGSASDRDLRRVATKLEQFRYVFTQLFPKMNFSAPIPTRVVVFKDKKTFDQFKPIEWASGYFQPGEDINYIVLTAEGDGKANFQTIFHEYTHFLIDNSIGRVNAPPWFNEGLAEFYEQFAIEDDRKVTLGALNDGHLQLLQRSDLIPFDAYFGVDYYTLHKQTRQSAQHFYAQSWALIHYLLQGSGGARRVQFDKFVELLMQGNKPRDAFQQAFQTDVATVETELKKYIAQRNFPQTVVSFKDRLVYDREMQTFPVTESDAKAFQGDLLYHSKRLEEAEALLKEALALDPNSSLANTSLGLVKMREKKFAEAKTYLEKAIQTDTQNYLAFFNYAYALSREGVTEYGFALGYSPADAGKIRQILRRAISLNPDYAESYNVFAFIAVVRNDELDEAVAMIKKALAIAPGNQWYSMRLAELYMRKEDFSAARELTKKILQTAGDDFLKVYAENSLRTINSLEAQLENIKNYKDRPQTEEVTDAPLSDDEIARRREKAVLESLNETLQRPKNGEKRLLGRLTNIDCQVKQVVFSIKAGADTLLFRTDSLETLRLISFEPEFVNAEFGCGAMKKENLAVIIFRPGENNGKIAGEIVSIEFVPKTFRFLTEEKK